MVFTFLIVLKNKMQCFAFFYLNSFFILKILSEKTLFRDSKAALLNPENVYRKPPKAASEVRVKFLKIRSSNEGWAKEKVDQ